MATVILRPTADSSLNHSCSSGSSGYAMLSEASADGDSTYIYQSISDTSSASATSNFKCSGTSAGKITISSVTLTVNAKTTKGKTADTASISYNLTVGGKSGSSGSGTLSTSYGNFSKTFSASTLGISGVAYDSFDASNFIATVTTSGKKDSTKSDTFQNRVTQVYLTVEYEPVSDASGTGIYLKQNGAYKQAQTAYKKVNGVWVEQTDIATLKTELQNGRYKYGG